MSRKRLPIDWGELEMALTWHADEGGYFLDLTTGELIQWLGAEDPEHTEEDLDAGLQEGRLTRIEPLPSSVEYGWMAEFVESVGDRALRQLLEVALNGPGAFRRFKDVLRAYPEDRDRWFAFRDARVREAAREWLEESGVEATSKA